MGKANTKIWTIGLIGVGAMGHGIAASLLRAGHGVRFMHHSGNRATDDLVSAGALGVADFEALCGGVDAVMVCVTGSDVVEALVCGHGGLASHLCKGQVLIDMSTCLPKTAQCVRDALPDGIVAIDAPMTRTPKEAAVGRLNLLVGGRADDVARVGTLLSTIADTVTHVGAHGAGYTVKLLHNFVSLGYSAVLAEAFAACDAQGVEPTMLANVLANGAGQGAVLDRFAPFITHGDSSALQFSIANAAKDTAYGAQILGGDGLSAAIAGIYARHTDAGYGEANVPEMVALLAREVPKRKS